MAASAKTGRTGGWRTTGFASRHEDLRAGTPRSLRSAPDSRLAFDPARDPLVKAQIDEMKKSEAKRREEGGRGSQMVKLHRPFPENKPSDHLARGAIRECFNRAWLREHRAARIAQLAAQRADRRGREPEQGGPPRGMSRTPQR